MRMLVPQLGAWKKHTAAPGVGLPSHLPRGARREELLEGWKTSALFLFRSFVFDLCISQYGKLMSKAAGLCAFWTEVGRRHTGPKEGKEGPASAGKGRVGLPFPREGGSAPRTSVGGAGAGEKAAGQSWRGLCQRTEPCAVPSLQGLGT